MEPQSGIIIVRNRLSGRQADHPTTSVMEVLYLSFFFQFCAVSPPQLMCGGPPSQYRFYLCGVPHSALSWILCIVLDQNILNISFLKFLLNQYFYEPNFFEQKTNFSPKTFRPQIFFNPKFSRPQFSF